MTKAPQNPLQIPELRARIALYVSVKDAIACTQVCKAWTDHFVYPIWHTIDFYKQMDLYHLGQDALRKYGQYIRIVKNLTEESDLSIILWSQASQPEHLTVVVQDTARFYRSFYDILRLTNSTLRTLNISCSSFPSSNMFFSVDALFPTGGAKVTSKLSSLTIHGLQITRNGFSALLRLCPLLTMLDMSNTVIRNNNTFNPFQHHKLHELTASLEQVFQPDPSSPNAPSLLVHFPALKDWEIPQSRLPTTTSIDAIAPDGDLHRSQTSSFDVIMAMTFHKDKLEVAGSYYPLNLFESDEVPQLEVQFQEHSWAILALPQNCALLTTLLSPLHHIDIDAIEKVRWTCMDLKLLYIRISGLDTEEKIDRTVQLWLDGRELLEKMGSGEGGSFIAEDTSIEARVARHLLQFKKLHRLWLRHQIIEVEL
ncbi:hypothetical protein BC939DRAFT_508297 [Gamsiella multidivaricata]|uniref:uncharacterized protein n=1 Tax=Gamsiella multidivaricata TaxID=101098 RepID=UPI00221EF099|nr:uncharacterized protein BC939DRAFT_508297 [Gamsiella multidivaricata]KAI7816463.1 hypothetical protein BC939DRAFT_508297 [Gamsiella multidivaricata]